MVMSLRTVCLAAAALLFFSLPASAQRAAPSTGTVVQQVEEKAAQLGEAARETAESLKAGSSDFVLTTDQLIGLAGGALIGAIAADMVFHGGAGFLAGALVGGYLGSWLYPPMVAKPGAI